jgi:hypothetical protein
MVVIIYTARERDRQTGRQKECVYTYTLIIPIQYPLTSSIRISSIHFSMNHYWDSADKYII